MSAREELVSTLEDLWLQRCGSKEERDSCRPDAEQLADAFAHELAEKIRKHADDPRVKPHLLDGEWTGLRMGADVIDRRC